MKIQVRYFAVFRERLRCDEESLELPDGARVADAIAALAARHPVIAALAGRFRAALNHEMSTDDAALADGDELALIPPVAGGSHHARLLAEPLSIDRVVAAVQGPDRGGIAVFIGMVRRQSQGRAVDRLEYEAYPEMAERVLARLCQEIALEIAGAEVAVEHRVGTLAVGDVAVVIAASAPHRAEAFAACRAMIERLKQAVPIWKKEIGLDGEVWVGLGP